jgi:small subunit ribosomal protein S5
VAKSIGSSNPYNMVRATVNALQNQTSPRSIAAKRGKKVSDILSRRTGGGMSESAGETTETVDAA